MALDSQTIPDGPIWARESVTKTVPGLLEASGAVWCHIQAGPRNKLYSYPGGSIWSFLGSFFGHFWGHFLDHFLVTFWTTFGCHFGADGPGVIFTAGLGVIFTAGLGVIFTAGLGVISTAGLGVIFTAGLI